MRGKRWPTYLALLGVLLHASLVVQHGSASLARSLDHEMHVAALGVICHGGAAVPVPASDIPSLPQPKTDWSFCPLCAGLAPAFAILGETTFDVRRPVPASVRVAIRSEAIQIRMAVLRPPPRGPPRVA